MSAVKKQSRRTISLKGKLYERVRVRCGGRGEAMAAWLERVVERELAAEAAGALQRLADDPRTTLRPLPPGVRVPLVPVVPKVAAPKPTSKPIPAGGVVLL